ncbi:MAG: S8 family serine peptidase [bacterium]
MKLVSLLMVVTCLGAANIHTHGVETPYQILPDENATLISFSNGIVFDTRIGEPELPAALTIHSQQGDGYYLIQMTGPIYDAWTEELKGTGIDIVGYIPHYAYLVQASAEEIAQARSLPFVGWTGIYQPAYKLEKDLLNNEASVRLVVQAFPNEDLDALGLQIMEMGYDVVERVDHPLCKTLDIIVPAEDISYIANITSVLWIQKWTEPTFTNQNCQWVLQTGWRSSIPSDPGARQVWFNGVVGNGVVLSSTDSGITTNHQQYYDASYPITSPGVFPNHRKIVGYKNYQGAVFGDNSAFGYHGTHVNCTIAGNDTTLGSSNYDGMAKQARIYFVDIGSNSGLVVPQNLTAMYDTIHLGRGLPYTILQHSGSWGWGNSSGTYLLQDASTDAYAYANPDFLNLYAAGNEYSAMRIRNPGMAKNVLTVGAMLNSTNSTSIASFSSRGPTQDGRMKPNIMAPGDGTTLWAGLISANGSGTNGYIGMSGTSMATPASNGSIGLIRHYLLAGFYPTGSVNTSDSIKYQSAALLRSMAMASCDPNVGFTIPNANVGWGRIDVDSILFFAGDSRNLILVDDTIGVTTGMSITDSFVVNSAIPLRVCLAWTDTAASSGANPTLVNNLHLELTAPSGTFYRGNQYSGGQSSSNPSSWDNINVEECARINSPQTGVWHITVIGQNVPNGPMGFAYAVTGDLSFNPGIEENTSNLIPTTRISNFGSIVKDKLSFEINLHMTTDVSVRILDLTGRVVTDVIDSRLPQGLNTIERSLDLASGVYFVKVDAGEFQKIEKLLVVR